MISTTRPRLKLNTWLLPPLVGLLVFLQLIFPFKGWILLLVVLGGVWLIAYLWVHSLAQSLHLTREIRFGWAQVGDRVEERFTLSNTSWLPALWVEIVDRSTLPSYQASRATGVDENSENSWSVWSVCTQRGVFRLGPTTLCSGDPFGIYSVTLEFPLATTMLVLPPVVALSQIQIAPGGRAGEGQRRAKVWEHSVDASSARDYVPGDSLSWIHWGITAHRDVLSVRLFDATPTSDWWVFLDLDQDVQVGLGRDSTLEHGVILAASIADQGLRSGHAVGLVAHGGNLVWLPPQRGELQRWQILRELAFVTGNLHSLQELFVLAQPYLKLRSSVIIITPATHGDWIKSLIPFMRRGIVPTVLLFDPVSFGGAGKVSGALGRLTEMEIAHHLVAREMLDRPETAPGRAGHWEWRTSPLGKAVAIHKPREANWRVLG